MFVFKIYFSFPTSGLQFRGQAVWSDSALGGRLGATIYVGGVGGCGGGAGVGIGMVLVVGIPLIENKNQVHVIESCKIPNLCLLIDMDLILKTLDG